MVIAAEQAAVFGAAVMVIGNASRAGISLAYEDKLFVFKQKGVRYNCSQK